jgi:hypothetical protein
MLRFHTPLVKPDVQISRIRLSFEDSRVRPRIDAGSPLDLDQAQILVQGPVGESCKPLSPYLVLYPQPLTKPVLGADIHAPVVPSVLRTTAPKEAEIRRFLRFGVQRLL